MLEKTMNLTRSKTGVFYLGLQNWLSHTNSNLFIGEKEQVDKVMERQSRYFVKIQGWVITSQSENHITFSYAKSKSPVMTLSATELSEEEANRYMDIKRRSLSKEDKFYGISSEQVGKTDILYPISDTGEIIFDLDE